MPQFVQNVEEIRQRAMQKIEEGAVTDSYKLDQNKAVSVLNEALATEIVCVLRYMHHYFMATGVHASAARDEFKEHADEEREHADRLGERIQQLGGVPDFNPGTLVQRSVSQYIQGESLADMIREDLIAERMVIDVYRKMIAFFGDKDTTTRRLLEDLLEAEEEHASDLSDLLYIVNPETGKTEGEDPGTEALRMSGQQNRNDGGSQQKSSSHRSVNNIPANEPNATDATAALPQRSPSGAADSSGPEPAHQPGTTGRTMNRRGRDEVDADDDLAVGGQSGGTRTPKANEPERKNRIA